MYEILISGHYPNINEKDIVRNVSINIFLSDEINTTTITNNNLTVVDYLYNAVPGVVSYDYTNPGTIDSVANILTFKPDTYLDPETTYFVYVNKFPDSVQATNGNVLQDTYKYTFYTGIRIDENNTPSYEDLLRADLEKAIKERDWCEAARISAILNGESSECAIPSGIIPPLDEFLILENTYPKNADSDIPLDRLRFIKLDFNDVMPASGIDYNSYISVITKGVLE